ncbi:hypothetical protein CCZ27_03105 [Thauera sinica]|nr:hypothetical protein CCZ27_03105 [Thauera sp. K11]
MYCRHGMCGATRGAGVCTGRRARMLARETMMSARMSEVRAFGMIVQFAADARMVRLSRKTR